MEELEKDPRIQQKIKRFRTKQAQMKHLFTEVTSKRHFSFTPGEPLWTHTRISRTHLKTSMRTWCVAPVTRRQDAP